MKKHISPKLMQAYKIGLPLLCFALLYFLCSFSLAAVTANDAHQYAVGSISSKTVTAPQDLVDE